MREKLPATPIRVAITCLIAAGLLCPSAARAHCDTMDGPVVTEAKAALARGDLAPVLKWVKPEYESEVRATFERTLAVRTLGSEARELADMYFFETVVRLHRAGEGEPYTGLKPAGTDPGRAVVASDEALAKGSVDALVKMVTDAVAKGIRARFARAREARSHADDSVAAGREYVQAYVESVHYVERLYDDAVAEHAAHDRPSASETEHRHRADH
jgi:hypothetical protein